MKKILTTFTVLMLLVATLAVPAGASEGEGDPGPTSTTVSHDGDGDMAPTTTVVDNPEESRDEEVDHPGDSGPTTTTVVSPGNDESNRPADEGLGEDSDKPGRAEERRLRREEKLRRERERREAKAKETEESADHPDVSTDDAEERPEAPSDRRDGDRPESRRAEVEKRLLRACREDLASESTDATTSEACRIIRKALSNADNGGENGQDGKDGQGDLTRKEIRDEIIEACRVATADDGLDDGSDPAVEDGNPGDDFGRCVRTLRRADARERVVQACRRAVGADNAEIDLDLAERCRRIAEHRPDLTELPESTKEVCQRALLGGSSRAEELCLRDIAENLDSGIDA